MNDITLNFRTGFYGGRGNTSDVPELFDIALNGRPYMLDQKHDAFRQGIQTIPLIRTQANNSDEPDESTINPEDLWPRAIRSWHKGAGQKDFDNKDSDRARFLESFGIDPWDRYRLSTLNGTSLVYPTAATNVAVLRVGSFLYVSDGNNVKRSSAPYTTWTDVGIQAGLTAQVVQSITSDGGRVYAALGSNGITQSLRGSSGSTVLNTLPCTLVSYVKGRLMAANAAAIYNVTGATVPTALFTHPNDDFRWVGFAEGQAVIYAAGYSGDKSLIYRTAVKADGTALDVPVVAGQLPDGEIIRSIQGYLSFVVVGTDLGFRIGTQDASGNITFGALVSTGQPVRAMEPQDRFVWFGWENYDAAHSGLGRMDLSVTTNEGAPAYASDLMSGSLGAPVQGSVTSVVTDALLKRAFAVSGKGLYVETSTPLDTGWMNTGKLNFGIPEAKIALQVAMKHEPLPVGGSVSVEVSPDDADFVAVGSSSVVTTTAPPEILRVPEVAAQTFQLRVTLTGGAVLERVDFRAYPTAKRGRTMKVPIFLHERFETATGNEQTMNVQAEYDAIESNVATQELVSFQWLGVSYSVLVSELWFQPHSPTEDRMAFNGTAVLTLKILGDR